jgi:hypothetical protein
MEKVAIGTERKVFIFPAGVHPRVHPRSHVDQKVAHTLIMLFLPFASVTVVETFNE